MKNNKRPPMKKGVLKRILKILFKEYRLQMIAVAACIVMVSLASTIASLFMNKFINYIGEGLENGLDSVSGKITVAVLSMLCIYALGWLASFAYTRIMAVVTQSFLHSMRKKMFDKMQSFPLRYFDTNAHGDIMSHYTNDIDAIRELVSSTLPHLMQSALIVGFLVFNMFYLSAWMALVVGFASIAMIVVAKKIGGRSAKNFMAMQRSIAKTEGFVEEMMNGQKVVKVFCHEEQSGKDFDKVNEELCKNATAANRFANILMPIMGNIGNILYVLVAFVGGLLIINSTPNASLQLLFAKLTGDETVSALVNISVVVPFLNASKQFTNNVSQVSQQINAIVMAMAGAGRVFELLDNEPEIDDGYVTLVNAREENGEIVETAERTGMWAWKHPHGDGSVTYTKLEGDVRMVDMDFGYVPEKPVLHDVTLYAEPGQKVAFVGATGAGKSSILNLIGRYYDIQKGAIRIDGVELADAAWVTREELRRDFVDTGIALTGEMIRVFSEGGEK